MVCVSVSLKVSVIVCFCPRHASGNAERRSEFKEQQVKLHPSGLPFRSTSSWVWIMCFPLAVQSLLFLFTCPAGDGRRAALSLVGKLRGGLLFQSVYDGLDAALHAGRDAASHRVRRRRRGAGGGPLRGRVRDQAFLIAQLEKRPRQRFRTVL